MSTRPLNTYALCPECLAALERERAGVGELGVALAYCPHAELFAVWNCGDVTLRPCDSPQRAAHYKREVAALVARVQIAVERLRSSGPH